MKTGGFSLLALAALLTNCATARPRQARLTDDDTIEFASRVTAFLIDEQGFPTIECWELPLSNKNSKSGAGSLSLAKGGDIEGIDVLTIAAGQPIYPPPSNGYNTEYRPFNRPSIYTVKRGLVGTVHRTSRSAAVDGEDDTEMHAFSLENGDDWFYFEDSNTNSEKSAQCANKNSATPLFTIQSFSGGITELLRIGYSKGPDHKVLHKGACIFSGIVPRSPRGGGVDEDL